MSIKDKVAIIGVGCTKFGDNYNLSYQDMMVEAAYEAFSDAGIEPKEIQAAYLGTYHPGASGGKSGLALCENLRLNNIPITRVENFCATGLEAIRGGVFSIASGMYDLVLAVGCEKMKDRPRGGEREATHPLLARGLTAPGSFALMATRYFHNHNIDKKVLAKVAVKNHKNGALNPKAHFQMEISEEQVLKAPIIAWPFGLFDCCPTTDGAAAAILCRADMAKNFKEDFVLIKGIGASVSVRGFYDPNYDYTSFRATEEAAKQAYQQAEIKNPKEEINFAEVHDCFTMTEILNYEDLGFANYGEGWKLIVEGKTNLDGELPVNPSGGLKSFGHPIGASGVRMVYEIVKQMQGKADKRQLKKTDVALAHNVGGAGGVVSCVTIIGRK